MKTEEILAKIKMIEEGILPVKSRKELSSMLDNLDEKDSRAFRRKFRKKWRKLAKSNRDLGSLLRIGNKNPNSSATSSRIFAVYRDILMKTKED
tara:strand:+ start:467 stop:748 length:282 start_codon:yes stop_codon:yes gene_type:complete